MSVPDACANPGSPEASIAETARTAAALLHLAFIFNPSIPEYAPESAGFKPIPFTAPIKNALDKVFLQKGIYKQDWNRGHHYPRA